MKLIQQYPGLVTAQDAALRLRQQGILTHLSSKNSFVVSGYITGAFKIGLWVVLDEQYFDACEYLRNSEHIVETGLSEAQLQALEAQASEQSFHFFNRIIAFTLMGLLTTISGIVYFNSFIQ